MDQKVLLREMHTAWPTAFLRFRGCHLSLQEGFNCCAYLALLLGDKTDHCGGNCALNLTSEWLSYSFRLSLF